MSTTGHNQIPLFFSFSFTYQDSISHYQFYTIKYHVFIIAYSMIVSVHSLDEIYRSVESLIQTQNVFGFHPQYL